MPLSEGESLHFSKKSLEEKYKQDFRVMWMQTRELIDPYVRDCVVDKKYNELTNYHKVDAYIHYGLLMKNEITKITAVPKNTLNN